MSQALIQCRDKHIYFSKGAVAHALVVSVLQIVIVPVWAYCCGVSSCWVILATFLSWSFEFVTHLHIDYVKSKYRVANQERVDRSRKLWLVMHAIDQCLHAGCILCCTAICCAILFNLP
ncbi:Transmembrane_domain-containing protein [Hexamita inflata]|uniref:Transmembrane domain-containing protein n=1 Tax=Hexamita inflata TaxID=28002 RepID=A0AA86P727_9EUKA|nr:Transmembrane domain-containing protein [Hexamita inflata]